MVQNYLLIVFVCVLFKCNGQQINVEQGALIGKLSDDGTFYEYMGIPYASTSKSRRFQSADPPEPWTGVFEATTEGNSCYQRGLVFGTEGSEDNCLNLNIYVPLNTTGKIPVMFFIHGGGFMIGSGSRFVYGPEFLIKHDIILVTINYRLGAWGFLCLGIKEAPGNAGLKDQLAALRWVKRNIESFGGDPNNITLFGQSAGALSASIMIGAKVTDGLFNKVIMQSGASTSIWGLNREPLKSASILAEQLGFISEDPYELYNFFLELPAHDLALAAYEKKWRGYYETELFHLPCIEKRFSGVEAIVTNLPYEMIKKSTKNISVIYGYNDNEGPLIAKLEKSDKISLLRESHVFTDDLTLTNDQVKTVDKVLENVYFSNGFNKENLYEYYKDIYFRIPQLIETEILLKKGLTVYNYNFKYAGIRNYAKLVFGLFLHPGAVHADDLFYLFNSHIWPLKYMIDSSAQSIIDNMTKMWTNFAKYGTPILSNDNSTTQWLPSSKDDLKCLYIDSEIKMGKIENKTTYYMWKNIYNKYGKT